MAHAAFLQVVSAFVARAPRKDLVMLVTCAVMLSS